MHLRTLSCQSFPHALLFDRMYLAAKHAAAWHFDSRFASCARTVALQHTAARMCACAHTSSREPHSVPCHGGYHSSSCARHLGSEEHS